MSKPLQIGITGGIGAGKSLICKIFKILGVPVYDADSRARALMTGDPVLKAKITMAFGAESYLADGSLNRTLISHLTFENRENLALLNSLVHPKVAHDYIEWVTMQGNVSYTIKEAALLFESGSDQQLDMIIVVSAPEEVRINRVLKRDPQRTRQDVQSIIQNQMDEDEKKRRANYLIFNDEREMVIPQVLNIDKLIREKTKTV